MLDKWAVVSGQLPMLEFTAAFRFLGGRYSPSQKHRVDFSFTFPHVSTHFCTFYQELEKVIRAISRTFTSSNSSFPYPWAWEVKSPVCDD
jgi:hypothetical protein